MRVLKLTLNALTTSSAIKWVKAAPDRLCTSCTASRLSSAMDSTFCTVQLPSGPICVPGEGRVDDDSRRGRGHDILLALESNAYRAADNILVKSLS